MLRLQNNFVLCGGTITEFNELTLGEVIDFIVTYVNSKKEAQNQRSTDDKSHKEKKQPTKVKFSYGRVED